MDNSAPSKFRPAAAMLKSATKRATTPALKTRYLPGRSAGFGRGVCKRPARYWPLLVLLPFLFGPDTTVRAANPDPDGHHGSYPGRVYTEMALHRQSVLRRARTGFQPQSAAPAP